LKVTYTIEDGKLQSSAAEEAACMSLNKAWDNTCRKKIRITPYNY